MYSSKSVLHVAQSDPDAASQPSCGKRGVSRQAVQVVALRQWQRRRAASALVRWLRLLVGAAGCDA